MCEPGQRKGKRERKMKNTIPPRFMFKPRWHPPLPFLILFSESLFPDCWSRVKQTLGTGLPPSWDTELRMHNSFCLRLHLTCECHLRLLLRLHHTCEPVLSCDPRFADCKMVTVFEGQRKFQKCRRHNSTDNMKRKAPTAWPPSRQPRTQLTSLPKLSNSNISDLLNKCKNRIFS